MCEIVSDMDWFDVQDVTTNVARVGYWYLAGAGDEKCRSGGHAFLEWVVEVLSCSTYADH